MWQEERIEIKNCSKDRNMGVKGGLKHNKIQDISKITRMDYHLQKNVQYMNIKKKLLVPRRI